MTFVLRDQGTAKTSISSGVYRLPSKYDQW
jgi:hypothetical protein